MTEFAKTAVTDTNVLIYDPNALDYLEKQGGSKMNKHHLVAVTRFKDTVRSELAALAEERL